MRRGGATQLFIIGLPLSTIMMFGRWASESSCRLYIRQGEAAMIQIERGLDMRSTARVGALAALGPYIVVVLVIQKRLIVWRERIGVRAKVCLPTFGEFGIEELCAHFVPSWELVVIVCCEALV